MLRRRKTLVYLLKIPRADPRIPREAQRRAKSTTAAHNQRVVAIGGRCPFGVGTTSSRGDEEDQQQRGR